MADDYREPELPKFEEPPSLPPDQPAVRTKVAHLGRIVPPTRMAKIAGNLAALPLIGLVSCAIVPVSFEHAWPLLLVTAVGIVAGIAGALLGLVDGERGGSGGRRAMLVHLGLLGGHVAVALLYIVALLLH